MHGQVCSSLTPFNPGSALQLLGLILQHLGFLGNATCSFRREYDSTFAFLPWILFMVDITCKQNKSFCSWCLLQESNTN